ncbi:MAG: hypothetical protein RR595_05625 [Lysinibacillus sp.]
MNLLINEPPLQVLPSLAVQIGLNDALILQQMHYWAARSNHIFGNRRWIYNSVAEWQKQFPFWSTSTVQRTIDRLVGKELVLVGNFNKLAMDKTHWYTINYEKLKAICDAFSQNDQMQLVKMSESISSDCANPFTQNDQSNTRDYTETTQKNKNSRKQAFDETSPEMVIANFFIGEIRKNRPEFKIPNNLTKWCEDIDKILRIDGMEKTEVCKLIRWVQTNDFWKSNVLSPAKLRKNYDQLVMQMQQELQQQSKKQSISAVTVPQPLIIDLNAGEDIE